MHQKALEQDQAQAWWQSHHHFTDKKFFTLVQYSNHQNDKLIQGWARLCASCHVGQVQHPTCVMFFSSVANNGNPVIEPFESRACDWSRTLTSLAKMIYSRVLIMISILRWFTVLVSLQQGMEHLKMLFDWCLSFRLPLLCSLHFQSKTWSIVVTAEVIRSHLKISSRVPPNSVVVTVSGHLC